MTAVASLQPLPRNGWSNGSGSLNMNQDEVARIFIPRKSTQRVNSSSSISSNSSTSSTATVTSTHTNGLQNGDINWGTRKKPARGVWPPSKSEPVSGLSTARSQSVPTPTSGPSAASAIQSALQQSPSPLLPAHHIPQSQPQPNGNSRGQIRPDAPAILHLLPMNGTFERKTITVPFSPDILRIGRQTNQKTVPTPLNGYFDSKVLSRQHAEIWAELDGKIWIRDVKSSNGTFVNGKRLSAENRDSEPHPLKEQDILELGIDIVSEDQKTVVHHKVAARVEYAGMYSLGNNSMELNFGELESNNVNGHIPTGPGNVRNRSASHGSMGNSRLNGIGGVASNIPAVYQAKWLQPVTMEQVVKRLNIELKQARLQAQDLHHTGSFVDALLTNDPSSVPNKIMSPSRAVDIKSRFSSEPPAPPPSQPLPEKPDAASLRGKLQDIPTLQPLLRRSDTEKPKLVAIPQNSTTLQNNIDPNGQILNLVDAFKAQSEKLKQMEDQLRLEREARITAEQRVINLQSPRKGPNDTKELEAGSDSTLDDKHFDAASLEHRLSTMQSEMSEMQLQMQKYRQRAEEAEADSQKHQKTLAEMVESIRRREDAAKQRRLQRRIDQKEASQSNVANNVLHPLGDDSVSDSDDAEALMDLDLNSLDDQMDITLTRGLQRQLTLTAIDGEAIQNLNESQLKELQKSIAGLTIGKQGVGRSWRQEQMAQTAPFASLLGVVLLGVGMMAYLNGWQRVTERA